MPEFQARSLHRLSILLCSNHPRLFFFFSHLSHASPSLGITFPLYPPITTLFIPRRSLGNFLILLLLLTFHQHLKCSSNLAHSLRHLVFFFFFSYFSKSEDGGIIVVCIKYCISGLSGQEKWKFKYLFLEEHSPQHFVPCGAGQQMGRVEKAVLASSGPTGARPLVTLEVSKRFVSFH